MNNEIKLPKEIEEAFNCIDYELSVCNDELPKILNYITDLQTKNEYLETWNSEIKIQLDASQQENERLEEKNNRLGLDNIMLKEELNIYKEHCEKVRKLIKALINGSEENATTNN